FFFGMGYSSLATARALLGIEPDARLSGTTRTENGAELLADADYLTHVFDGAKAGSTLVPDLHRATHVVQSIPPDAAVDPVLRLHRGPPDGDRDVEWRCHFAAGGVPADFDGAGVDEATATRPVNRRWQTRVEGDAERCAYAEAHGLALL